MSAACGEMSWKDASSTKRIAYVIAMANEAETVLAHLTDKLESREYGRRVITGAAESGLAESGLAESGAAESGLAESGLAESGLAESGAAESGLVGRSLRDRRVMVVISGVGKVNAAAATQFAIQAGAEEIVNVGVCGGFEPSMKIGDLYEVDRAVEYDFDLAQLNGTAVGVLNERSSPYIPLQTTGKYPAKTLATGDHFNDNTADLPLLSSLGVGLRDMEGAAIAHVCETAGVPCRALKCVTNVLGAGGTAQYAENLERCLAILKDAVANV